jgi:hypothetical protein
VQKQFESICKNYFKNNSRIQFRKAKLKKKKLRKFGKIIRINPQKLFESIRKNKLKKKNSKIQFRKKKKVMTKFFSENTPLFTKITIFLPKMTEYVKLFCLSQAPSTSSPYAKK